MCAYCFLGSSASTIYMIDPLVQISKEEHTTRTRKWKEENKERTRKGKERETEKQRNKEKRVLYGIIVRVMLMPENVSTYVLSSLVVHPQIRQAPTLV